MTKISLYSLLSKSLLYQTPLPPNSNKKNIFMQIFPGYLRNGFRMNHIKIYIKFILTCLSWEKIRESECSHFSTRKIMNKTVCIICSQYYTKTSKVSYTPHDSFKSHITLCIGFAFWSDLSPKRDQNVTKTQLTFAQRIV